MVLLGVGVEILSGLVGYVQVFLNFPFQPSFPGVCVPVPRDPPGFWFGRGVVPEGRVWGFFRNVCGCETWGCWYVG